MRYLALQIPGGNSINTNVVPTGGPDTLSNIIGAGLDLAVVVAIFVCLLMLILGGFEWIFSQGDKQKLNQARQRLAMSIIGLVVVLAAILIVNVINAYFFGANTVNFLRSQ